jgi:hypothetical protein
MQDISGSLTIDSLRALAAKRPFFAYPWACNPGAGFGANHSGLTKSLTMCLQKGIGFRFVALARPQGIAIARGYGDYFLPFCEEVSGRWLPGLNRNQLPGQSRLPWVAPLVSALLQATTRPRARYFFFTPPASIPSFATPFSAVPYDILRASVSHLLWHYTPDVGEEVAAVKRELPPLPEPYLATLVRRGDKILEATYAGLEGYVRPIQALQGRFRRLFIAGDDLEAMQALASLLPELECVFLRPAFTAGYDNASFRQLPAEQRRAAMIRFFAQVDLLRESAHFVATRTTNVSYIVNAFRAGRDVTWLD